MIHPEKAHDHDQSHPVGLAADDHRQDRGDQGGAGQPVALAAEQRVADVAAVELTDGDHVEAGHEQPHPACHEERIGDHGRACRQVGPHERLDPGPEGRECKRIRLAHGAADDPQRQERDRHHQARQRSGDRDVEELPTVGPRAFHSDHRAEGAGEQNRHRDEEGQRGRDAVELRGDEVARLMGGEHGHHGRSVDEPPAPVLLHRRGDVGVVHAQQQRLPADGTGRERGQRRQQIQERLQPHPRPGPGP